jgi:hypothetical protein
MKTAKKIYNRKHILLAGSLILALLYIAFNIWIYLFGTRSNNKPASSTTYQSFQPAIHLPSGRQEYILSHGKNVTGPKPQTIIIDPLTPVTGETQTVTIVAQYNSPITEATITLFTDSDNHTYPLKLQSGTPTNGSWSGSWDMPESISSRYELKITLVSSTGNWINTMKFR